jgi:hypothetical protein
LIATSTPVHSREATPMPAKKEKVTVYTCSRCAHRWVPRNPFDPIDPATFPKICPVCKNTLWNEPKNERRRSKADE